MNNPDIKQKASILVIDDSPENITLMSDLLKESYKVKVATSGRRGISVIQSKNPPDIILLDIMMPEMDGYEVCRQVKLNANTRDIPIIFLTAKAEKEDERYGLKLGAIDYITKPINPAILMARVANHLAIKSIADDLRKKNAQLEMRVKQQDEEATALIAGVLVQEIDLKKLKIVFHKLSELLISEDPVAAVYFLKHQDFLHSALAEQFEQLQSKLTELKFAAALKLLQQAELEWQRFS
ncbi:MAG: response regulator [Methylococcaceae bacterium]|jgi:response regulator RpfG family c-di-GMP phosphodiesterase